ncbi:MAG: selenocysteine-specific translation elongation factor [Betaproteobacteria bacterium]
MIIGTAGHIDHGKTSLVRALTGVDTDRLPEEKKRGITIELGYAYLPVADDGQKESLGFIDVPGHEKFIHTMLAGATGIDYGLVVVAADDGVMPQTREHVDILSLLGVAQGAVVITKIDRVDEARIHAVEQELNSLLAATPLAGSPVFAVSNVSGTGIPALRAHLVAAHIAHQRMVADEQFRLAVDRVFTLEGHGTVVTGTVFSGRIAIGDRVVLTPPLAGKQLGDIRVRGIHAQNRRTDEGRAGQRCALNLAGLGKEDIARGQWVVAPDVALATDRIDVSLTLLATEKNPLRAGTHVHAHLGAAHCLARVIPLDRDAIAPGESAIAQLVLSRPLGAWIGDRLVLRDASATRTLAGGRVLDPFAPARYRKTPERLHCLAAHALRDAAQSLDQLTQSNAWGVDLAQFARARSRTLQSVRALPSRCVRLGVGADEFGFDNQRLATLTAALVSAMDAHHARHPDEAGMDAPRLKRIAMPKLPDSAMNAMVATLMEGGQLVQSGVWLARPAHVEKLNQQDKLIADRALPLIAEGKFDPPWVRDIARAIGHPEAAIRGVLARLARRGELYAVVKDLYYDIQSIEALSAIAIKLDESDHTVRAAAFRDATGLGRKRAIQVLEFFDQVGFTRRQGDDHRVRNRRLFAKSTQAPVAAVA